MQNPIAHPPATLSESGQNAFLYFLLLLLLVIGLSLVMIFMPLPIMIAFFVIQYVLQKQKSSGLMMIFIASIGLWGGHLFAGPDSAKEAEINIKALSKTILDQDVVHGTLNLNFSDHHLTPRGLNLNSHGVIFQPLLKLDWNLYKPDPSPEQAINAVTFTTGIWNEIDSYRRGKYPGNWSEVDSILGPNVEFLKDWKFESPFITFVSETGTFRNCWAWNPKLTYHDHLFKNFSINPYIEFFDELENKVTCVFNRAKSQESYYGVLGLDPTYVFEDLPLKLDAPTYCTIPGEDFYQRKNGTGGGSGLGLFTTMLKATVPLKFIPEDYGKWSFYAGVQYYYLNNPGLLDGNQFKGADKSRERNLMAFHTGLTLRF